MLGQLAEEIIRSKTEHQPIVVGITGLDASGKSSVAATLEEQLTEAGIPVQLIHVDDFHRAKSDRYSGEASEAAKYYYQSFDFERLVNVVLQPIREAGRLDTTLTCLDVATDTWSVERHIEVEPSTVVLLEGVFLFREEVAHYIDLMIFLKVNEEVVLDRAVARDVSVYGPEILHKYKTKYLPAQREYLATFPSERNADIIIDNNDWENPAVIKWPL